MGRRRRQQPGYLPTLLGEQHPLRLTTDPSEDGYPAWSPDGKYIAFIRRLSGTQAEIILVSPLGGPERILRRIRLGAWITGRMLAWSPDGKWLCLRPRSARLPITRCSCYRLSREHVRQLYLSTIMAKVIPHQHSHPMVAGWLSAGSLSPSHSQLLLQRLSSDLRPEGAPLVVEDAGVNPSAPVWTPDGKRVLFLEGDRIMQVGDRKSGAAILRFERSFSGTHSHRPRGQPRLVASLKTGPRDLEHSLRATDWLHPR